MTRFSRPRRTAIAAAAAAALLFSSCGEGQGGYGEAAQATTMAPSSSVRCWPRPAR